MKMLSIIIFIVILSLITIGTFMFLKGESKQMYESINESINKINIFPYNNIVILNNTVRNSIFINSSISLFNVSWITYSFNVTNYTIYDYSLELMYGFENNSNVQENITLAVDSSLSSINLTCSLPNCPFQNNTGRYGGSLQFDGTDDYMNTSLNNNPINFTTSNFTICTHIYLANNTNYNTILDKRNASAKGYLMGIANNGKVNFVYNWGASSVSVQSNTSLSTNTWYYVCGTTARASSIKVYLNGKEDNSTSGGSANNIGTNTVLTIGNKMPYGASSWNYFNGSIDELRMWNRSLSSNEINQQYMTNLQRYNSTTWYLYVNQTTNSTTYLYNGTYPYEVFARNSSGFIDDSLEKCISFGFGYSCDYIDSCRIITLGDRIYTLNVSINSTGTCLDLRDKRITIDLNGFFINYSTNGTIGYGINVKSQSRGSILKNGYIYDGNITVANRFGINITNNLDNITITNLTIILTSQSNGINTLNVNSNFTIANSTIWIKGGGTGILTSSINKLNLINNNITSGGIALSLTSITHLFILNNTIISSTGTGISTVGLKNAFIFNNYIKGTGTNNGLSLGANTHNTTIINSTIITGSGGNSLRSSNGNNNFSIIDSYLNVSSDSPKIFIVDAGSLGGYFNFTNITMLNRTKIDNNIMTWTIGVNGTFINNWYLDIITNYTNGTNAQNIAINSSGNDGILKQTGLTDINGYERHILTEYIRNNTSGLNYKYYSNYSINATDKTKGSILQSVNMSNNNLIFFTFNTGEVINCAYTSGNWIPICNCNFNQSINLGGNNFTFLGQGVIDLGAYNLTNFRLGQIGNLCIVKSKGGRIST